MNTFKELEEYCEQFDLTSSLKLDEEETVSAIIGHDDVSGALVYDYDLLVEAFAKHFGKYDEQSEEKLRIEAVDWIDYNVIRSLPYPEQDYVAYDKEWNELGRMDVRKEDAKAKMEELAGPDGHVDIIDYVKPHIIHTINE